MGFEFEIYLDCPGRGVARKLPERSGGTEQSVRVLNEQDKLGFELSGVCNCGGFGSGVVVCFGLSERWGDRERVRRPREHLVSDFGGVLGDARRCLT